jgi:septation ring formation regulator EzrA
MRGFTFEGTMANLNEVLRQLREEHKQAQQHVEKLDEAISVISGLVTRNGSTAVLNGAQPKRFVSYSCIQG